MSPIGDVYEHSEQARAPHTNGPRDVPRCSKIDNGDARESPSYLSFFLERRRPTKKIKRPPGAAIVAANAHVNFFSAGLRLS